MARVPPSVSVRRARAIALLEATSYLALMVAVVVKYVADEPAGVQWIGPVHGVVVLIYATTLVRYRQVLGWDLPRVVEAIVLGSVPLGGFWVERRWMH